MVDAKGIIIGLIVFSMFFAGIVTIMGDFSNQYNVTLDTSKYQSYNKLNAMTNMTEDFREDIEGAGSDVTLASAWDTSSTGALTGMKLIFTSIPTFFSVIQDIIMNLGFPAWFLNGILACFVVIIVFIVASSIFRYGV